MAALSPAAVAASGNLRCVVVAVDGSEESMNALRWSLDNLRLDAQGEDGAEEQQQGEPCTSFMSSPRPPLPLVSTPVHPLRWSQSCGGPRLHGCDRAHQRRISEAIIAHAMHICAEKHVNAKSQVVVGDPKELICQLTANLHADLLVMGCRAFGPIKRMFLGSVSNYCINHVQCPVVVIKGTQQA